MIGLSQGIHQRCYFYDSRDYPGYLLRWQLSSIFGGINVVVYAIFAIAY
jgi:hypothetical protein